MIDGVSSSGRCMGSKHNQFDSQRLVKHEAGFQNPRLALIGSNQLWRINDSPYYRELIKKLMELLFVFIVNILNDTWDSTLFLPPAEWTWNANPHSLHESLWPQRPINYFYSGGDPHNRHFSGGLATAGSAGAANWLKDQSVHVNSAEPPSWRCECKGWFKLITFCPITMRCCAAPTRSGVNVPCNPLTHWREIKMRWARRREHVPLPLKNMKKLFWVVVWKHSVHKQHLDHRDRGSRSLFRCSVAPL